MKTLKNEITRLDGQIFRNSQYRRHYQNQLAMIACHTPETATRTRQRIAELTARIAADNQQLETLQTHMITTIEALDDWRIQEILTRRYVSDEAFEQIAAAMHYDIRWVYRLHQQGLVLTKSLAAWQPDPAA